MVFIFFFHFYNHHKTDQPDRQRQISNQCISCSNAPTRQGKLKSKTIFHFSNLFLSSIERANVGTSCEGKQVIQFVLGAPWWIVAWPRCSLAWLCSIKTHRPSAGAHVHRQHTQKEEVITSSLCEKLIKLGWRGARARPARISVWRTEWIIDWLDSFVKFCSVRSRFFFWGELWWNLCWLWLIAVGPGWSVVAMVVVMSSRVQNKQNGQSPKDSSWSRSQDDGFTH